MKYSIDPDSTEEMGMPVMNSAIKAFPSTQSAGISYTASLVTCDEHAAHPYADANYISSKPTRDQGGQFISVFTADPYSNDNLATAIFTDALEGKNDFVPLFFPYDVVPGRDDEWYDRTKRNIPERDLAQLSPDLYMAKNFPRTIEEALGLSSSVAVFDKKVLNSMMDSVRSQINSGELWQDIDNSVCHVYKDYSVGRQYIAASDVSLGVGGDYGTLCIMDAKTGEVVADIMSKEIKPEELAYHSVNLLKRFRNPRWWIEHNLYGRTVIRTAIDLGYRNFGYTGDKPIPWSTIDDREIRRVGFWTDEKSRADLFGSLIASINTFQITLYNEEGLRQFYFMIRNVAKGGKIEASSGKHDDYVITVGLCWLKRSDVLPVSQPKPIETLHWGGQQKSIKDFILKGGVK
uniref:Putative terminase n=2 Tax=viral metagenome TaxID=1070528 RepID=A0A6H1ZGP7_9ZZZZ